MMGTFLRDLHPVRVVIFGAGMLCLAAAGQPRVQSTFASAQDRDAAAFSAESDQTVEEYQGKITAAPFDPKPRIELAQLLSKIGRLPEAIEAYREALVLQPTNETIEVALAETYRRVHNDEQARTILSVVRRKHPHSVAVLRALGSLEMDAQAYDSALEVLRTAMKVAPADRDLRSLLATTYLKKGDSASALRELGIVLSRDPNNGMARFLRAGIYADSGENEKAAVDAEKVVTAKPEYLPAKTLYAKVLVRLNDCRKAVETLDPSAQRQTLDSDSLFLLASAYDCDGQKAQAAAVRAEFEAASRAQHEKTENHVQSLHLVEQANALAIQNKLTEAQELLQQALEKNPENAFAYSQQAKICFSLHQRQLAKQLIERALSIQPYQPDFLFVSGVIEASEGNLDLAMTRFHSVTAINPAEADAYYEIGKIWMQKDDRAQASRAFRRASELAPDDSDYRRAVSSASKVER
jgi:tetratricopeptide (TPR) repeat protein